MFNENVLYNCLPVTENENIAVYGGSFNPPHMGHMFLCLAVLSMDDVDEIWVLPSASHPNKEMLRSFDSRMEMCKMSFRHLDNVSVLPVERYLPKPNYTKDTIKALISTKPSKNFSYIVGSDLVEDIPDWDNSEGIDNLVDLVVVPRQGYPIVDLPDEIDSARYLDIDFDLPEISSSNLNKLMKRDACISGMVDYRVGEILNSNSVTTRKEEIDNLLRDRKLMEKLLPESPRKPCKMSGFERGGKVVCVRPDERRRVEFGRKYTVDKVSNHKLPMIKLKLEHNKAYWGNDRFVLVDEFIEITDLKPVKGE